jgi:hypothetical protein
MDSTPALTRTPKRLAFQSVGTVFRIALVYNPALFQRGNCTINLKNLCIAKHGGVPG